jgi:hypothetical protein
MEFIDKSYSFLKTAINATLDLSIEKSLVIKALNNILKEQYVSGATNRLIVAGISTGDKSFKHSMSTNWFRSGFMLTIQNDNDLSLQEAHTAASFILNNKPFVRQLIVFGFDTLIVKGKNTRSIRLKLSENDQEPTFLK